MKTFGHNVVLQSNEIVYPAIFQVEDTEEDDFVYILAGSQFDGTILTGKNTGQTVRVDFKRADKYKLVKKISIIFAHE